MSAHRTVLLAIACVSGWSAACGGAKPSEVEAPATLAPSGASAAQSQRRLALSVRVGTEVPKADAKRAAAECLANDVDDDDCIARTQGTLLQCEQQFVACVYACDGRIVSNNMRRGAFDVTSGDVWTVKVVGPDRCRGEFDFTNTQGKVKWSVLRNADAPSTPEGGAPSPAQPADAGRDVATSVPLAPTDVVAAARRALAALRVPTGLEGATKSALDASAVVALSADGGLALDKDAVAAARTKLAALVDASMNAPGTFQDAAAALAAALGSLAKSLEPSPLSPPPPVKVAEESNDWHTFAMATFTVPDDITIQSEEMTVSSKKKDTPFPTTVRFNVSDHGHYVVDFKFGGVLVFDGRPTYSVMPSTGPGARTIASSATVDVTTAIFMDLFVFGGRRRGIAMPWLPSRGFWRDVSDLVAFEVGLQLDFTRINELDRFARRGLIGLLFEPVTGISISAGVALGAEQTLRGGYVLPAGATEIPVDAYHDTFSARPYFSIALSPELISLVRTAVSGIPGAGEQNQKK